MTEQLKRSERVKLFEIGMEQHFKFLAALMGILLLAMGVWYFWSARNSANVVAATNAQLAGILSNLNEKVTSLDTTQLNAIAASVKGRVDALEPAQTALTKTIDQARTEMVLDSAELRARLRTLDTVLISLRGIGDETRAQVKQNGDSLNRTVEESTKVLGSLNKTITDADTRVTKLLDDGSLLLETANPRVQNILDHADALIIDADGRIKAFEPIQTNLAGITSDFNAMTTDSKNKLHELLFPSPKHGWARVGQLATYAIRPIFEGARLYFSLTALPVRLTQPIPMKP